MAVYPLFAFIHLSSRWRNCVLRASQSVAVTKWCQLFPSSRSITFLKPVYSGDTVTCTCTLLELGEGAACFCPSCRLLTRSNNVRPTWTNALTPPPVSTGGALSVRGRACFLAFAIARRARDATPGPERGGQACPGVERSSLHQPGECLPLRQARMTPGSLVNVTSASSASRRAGTTRTASPPGARFLRQRQRYRVRRRIIGVFCRRRQPQDGTTVAKILTRGLISKTLEEVMALEVRPRI